MKGLMRMNRQSLWLWLLVIVLLSGCVQETEATETALNKSPYKETAFLMGTVVTVRIYDQDKEQVLESVFDRIYSLTEQIDAGETDSEIDKINLAAGVEPVKVSADIYELVALGKEHSTHADGTFDISIGPLTSLWHIGYDDARKPEQAEIDAVLSFIDYNKIELNNEEQTVFLKEKGMKLDLGAIAKGFITDEVKEVMQEHDVKSAIIDLGGNIFVIGTNSNGDKWNVGIQDPFSPRGETVGKLKAKDQSIVTSGVYERFLEVDGVKYHHLLNPKDGYPFMNDIAGVSIITDRSVDGDALSTAVFSKGLKDGMEYIESIKGAEAIFISNDKKVYTTRGLKGKFELTSEAFEMARLP